MPIKRTGAVKGKYDKPFNYSSHNKRDPTSGNNMMQNLESVREQVRSARFNPQSNAVRNMINMHRENYPENGRIDYGLHPHYGEDEDPQAAANQTYGTHAELNLGKPTNRSTRRVVTNSNKTVYDNVYGPKGPRKQSAVRGRPQSFLAKPVGGARKKTRKNKKESRTKSKSRKLRKSRK